MSAAKKFTFRQGATRELVNTSDQGEMKLEGESSYSASDIAVWDLDLYHLRGGGRVLLSSAYWP